VFEQQEQANIATFLPGDTYRALQTETQFSNITSDLCLLPIYVVSYRYQNKLYRFLVNGQTGKVSGEKPVSWTRIAIAVAIAAVLILIFAWVMSSR